MSKRFSREKDVDCQDKSGPSKIHEVILVLSNLIAHYLIFNTVLFSFLLCIFSFYMMYIVFLLLLFIVFRYPRCNVHLIIFEC